MPTTTTGIRITNTTHPATITGTGSTASTTNTGVARATRRGRRRDRRPFWRETRGMVGAACVLYPLVLYNARTCTCPRLKEGLPCHVIAWSLELL